MRTLSNLLVAVLLLLAGATPAIAQWQRYTHPELGFSVELPTAGYTVDTSAPERLTLREEGGSVQIDVFGLRNDLNLPFREFAAMVEGADPSRRVTYRAGGRRWIVISGYLGGEAEDTIFYAKFLSNASGTALSAFEISYPRADKRRLDAVVTRIEKSLTAPVP